jgi:hypothetical protein
MRDRDGDRDRNRNRDRKEGRNRCGTARFGWAQEAGSTLPCRASIKTVVRWIDLNGIRIQGKIEAVRARWDGAVLHGQEELGGEAKHLSITNVV